MRQRDYSSFTRDCKEDSKEDICFARTVNKNSVFLASSKLLVCAFVEWRDRILIFTAYKRLALKP